VEVRWWVGGLIHSGSNTSGKLKREILTVERKGEMTIRKEYGEIERKCSSVSVQLFVSGVGGFCPVFESLFSVVWSRRRTGKSSAKGEEITEEIMRGWKKTTWKFMFTLCSVTPHVSVVWVASLCGVSWETKHRQDSVCDMKQQYRSANLSRVLCKKLENERIMWMSRPCTYLI
jgi:hypothetical protein